MAYYDEALLSADNDFLLRCTACATNEGETNPTEWVNSRQWQLAATPGFADSYAYALMTGIQNPGRDQSVISDPQILSAVQALMNPVEPLTESTPSTDPPGQAP